jgi:hypothetical protein
LALVATLFLPVPILPTLRALVSPASSALAACNRRISASIATIDSVHKRDYTSQ